MEVGAKNEIALFLSGHVSGRLLYTIGLSEKCLIFFGHQPPAEK